MSGRADREVEVESAQHCRTDVHLRDMTSANIMSDAGEDPGMNLLTISYYYLCFRFTYKSIDVKILSNDLGELDNAGASLYISVLCHHNFLLDKLIVVADTTFCGFYSNA